MFANRSIALANCKSRSWLFRSISTFKCSPAAFWHAKNLGIDLGDIEGTGPKGHITKNDILSFDPAKRTGGEEIFSFLVELEKGSVLEESLIKRCVDSLFQASGPFGSSGICVNYRLLPETEFIQLEIRKSIGSGNSLSMEKIKDLLKVYLSDSKHLLL